MSKRCWTLPSCGCHTSAKGGGPKGTRKNRHHTSRRTRASWTTAWMYPLILLASGRRGRLRGSYVSGTHLYAKKRGPRHGGCFGRMAYLAASRALIICHCTPMGFGCRAYRPGPVRRGSGQALGGGGYHGAVLARDERVLRLSHHPAVHLHQYRVRLDRLLVHQHVQRAARRFPELGGQPPQRKG